jgi:hypothetical protein
MQQKWHKLGSKVTHFLNIEDASTRLDNFCNTKTILTAAKKLKFANLTTYDGMFLNSWADSHPVNKLVANVHAQVKIK